MIFIFVAIGDACYADSLMQSYDYIIESFMAAVLLILWYNEPARYQKRMLGSIAVFFTCLKFAYFSDN